jgi:hypothetical protein
MGIMVELRNMKIRSRIAGVLGALTLAGATLFWAKWGREDVLALANPLAIATSPPDDLWYLPNGGPLVAVGHDDQKGTIWIRKWLRNSVGKPQESTFDFPAKLRVRPRYSLRADTSGQVGKSVAFVVAPDTKAIAWVWSGTLWSQEVEPKSVPSSFDLGNKTPVRSLAFLTPTRFAILYEGGIFNVREAGDDPQSMPGTKFSPKAVIWSQGERPVISSFDTGGVYSFDFRGKMSFGTLPGEYQNGSVVGATPKGRVAVGTSDGLVIFPIPPNSAGLDLGSVNAIAFYNDDEVIAGGTGTGLFLVKSKPGIVESVTPIRNARPNNVRLLAVSGSDIAFATPTAVIAGTLKASKAETPTSALVWKWALGVISVLAFTMALLRDSRE